MLVVLMEVHQVYSKAVLKAGWTESSLECYLVAEMAVMKDVLRVLSLENPSVAWMVEK